MIKDIKWNGIPLVARLLRTSRMIGKLDPKTARTVARSWKKRIEHIERSTDSLSRDGREFLKVCAHYMGAIAERPSFGGLDQPGDWNTKYNNLFIGFLEVTWEMEGFPDFPTRAKTGDVWTDPKTRAEYVRLPNRFWLPLDSQEALKFDLPHMHENVGWRPSTATIKRVRAIKMSDGSPLYDRLTVLMTHLVKTKPSLTKDIWREAGYSVWQEALHALWKRYLSRQDAETERSFIAHVAKLLHSVHEDQADSIANLLQYMSRFTFIRHSDVKELLLQTSVSFPSHRSCSNDIYSVYAFLSGCTREEAKKRILAIAYSLKE